MDGAGYYPQATRNFFNWNNPQILNFIKFAE